MGLRSTSYRDDLALGPLLGGTRSPSGLRDHVPSPRIPSVRSLVDRNLQPASASPEGRQLFVLANLIAAIDLEGAANIAARLLARFGSVLGVLGASDDVITSIADDGGSLAHLLRFAKETLQEGFLEEVGGDPVSHENGPFLRYVISELGSLREEALLAVFLDNEDRFLGQEIVAKGTRIALTFETRRLLRSAVERNAYGLIIAHNHPSGRPHPSPSDITATATAKAAAEHLGIRLVDHLIVAGSVAFSMKRSGQL